ncbi:MAG TPA: cytochrome c oxidase assembly protein [Candidatus Acidoferrum sp.]
MISCSTLAAFGAEISLWTEWSWTPGIVLPLVLGALMYGAGLARMATLPRAAGLTWKEPLFFASGWLALFMALLSPIHELGEQLFWVHMTQHEVLVLVCAPLLVLGHPLRISLWALPAPLRKFVGRAVNAKNFADAWRLISTPVSTWTLHATAMLVWHIPALFDATVTNPFVHAAQHVSFLGTGLLFWWTALKPHSSSVGYGVRSLFVFTTAVYTSLLGAILTFSQHTWYAPYADTAPLWHLSALEDQQLGGLIMWVPGGTVLFAMTLLMVVRWMRESEVRTRLTSVALLLGKTTVPHED